MNRFKTYAFWVALSSAIVIFVQSVGNLFGFEIESSTIENVIMSICGVLVVLGIVTKAPEQKNSQDDSIMIEKFVDETNTQMEINHSLVEDKSTEEEESEAQQEYTPEMIEVDDIKSNDIIYIENNTENT